VRIAVTIDQLEETKVIADEVLERGYAVSINLMRASTLSDSEVRYASATLGASGVTIFYLADSFGGLLPDVTRMRIRAARDAFRGRVGFHAHDNMGLALANSVAAMEAGATMIDASVRGMGRGGGNARTEQLLLFMMKAFNAEFSAEPLFDLVDGEFARLQEQHPWGATSDFMMSGLNDQHPDSCSVLVCR
jgi:4-hydroxy 2-oxovalerate aldolase